MLREFLDEVDKLNMNDILITGDIYLGDEMVQPLACEGDADKLFGQLTTLLKESSLSVGNLESPLTEGGEKIQKKGPYLKADPIAIKVLKNAGFDLLTLANNHILDYGYTGLESTLETCDKAGLSHVGAGLNPKSARKFYKTTIRSHSVILLNFAENEFANVGNQSFGANPLDLINNQLDIQEAKKMADYVVVILHGGREHFPLPSPQFRKTLRYYADSGANAVLAHHTHCVSGYEVYKDVPIFYGLGNCLFNNLNGQNRPLWNTGLAVGLSIEKGGGIIFELHPFSQFQGNTVGLRLMLSEEKAEFLREQEALNSIISNEDELNVKWENYISQQRNHYVNNLLIGNSLLKKFINRKLLPDSIVYNKEYITTCINLIQCESHREILLGALRDKLAETE